MIDWGTLGVVVILIAGTTVLQDFIYIVIDRGTLGVVVILIAGTMVLQDIKSSLRVNRLRIKR